MIIVHHLENSRSQRILWMLEELGADYEVKRYARDSETQLAPPELLKIHPLGKSPVITDGEQTIAETGAIIEYLLETHGGEAFVPTKGSPDYWTYKYWLHYGEGSLMPLMVMSLLFSWIENAKMPFFAKPIAKKIVGTVRSSYLGPSVEKNVAMVESHLAKNDWFAGENMSGADFIMCFPLEAVAARKGVPVPPHIKAYLAKIQSRAAWQKALASGGPYSVSAR